MIKVLKKNKELEKICKDAKPGQLIIVHVWTPDCEACEELEPVYLACSMEFPNHQFIKIAADQLKPKSKKLLLFFYSQELVSTSDRRIQLHTEATLTKLIEKVQLEHCPCESPIDQPVDRTINPTTRRQPPHKRVRTGSSDFISNVDAYRISKLCDGSSDRIALVIGNSKYENDPLTNPVNDAKDISTALHLQLGFDVTIGYDLSLVEMKTLISLFVSKITPHVTTTFLFFAGHGVQVNGSNYLIPVNNGHFESDADVVHDAVKADWMLDKITECNPLVSIVVLDACRHSVRWLPRAATRGGAVAGGLAPMDARGSIIAYSCKPGTLAVDSSDNNRNSTFTKHLLENINSDQDFAIMFRRVVRGVSLETKRKQRPSLECDLDVDFVSLSLAS